VISSFAPGALVYVRTSKFSGLRSNSPVVKSDDARLAVVIKKVGKDPNDHEYFEILMNGQVVLAWDDELERRD
jgi:hypothetical protein